MAKGDIDSEKLVERKLVAGVKSLGGICLKLVCTHIIGLPDRMCLFPKAKIAFVELKTTKKEPKKIQLLRHDQLRQLGFRVEVIDSVDKVKAFLETF